MVEAIQKYCDFASSPVGSYAPPRFALYRSPVALDGRPTMLTDNGLLRGFRPIQGRVQDLRGEPTHIAGAVHRLDIPGGAVQPLGYFDCFLVNGGLVAKANRVPVRLSEDMGSVPLSSALASDKVGTWSFSYN